MGFLYSHFDSIVTIFVTVLGFMVTIYMTNTNFRNELRKEKVAVAVQATLTLPYDISQLMNRMIMKKPGKQGKSSDIVDEYGEILSKVLAYGSRNAVDIAILLQRLSYGLKEGAEEGRWKALAAFSLLITQLKYDLTLEVISPESWFKLRITDYEKMQDEIRREINFIIDELGLSKEFRV